MIVFCNDLINKIVLNIKFYQWNIEICLAQLCKVNIDNELYQDCMGWRLKVQINFINAPKKCIDSN